MTSARLLASSILKYILVPGTSCLGLDGARRHRDARAQVILIDRMAGGTRLVKGFAMDRIANEGG